MTDLPHDPEAEKATLSACLNDPDALTQAAPLLDPTDFYAPAHETIWATVLAMHGAQEHVDAITLAARLTRDGTLDQAGGAPYLIDLKGHTLVTSNVLWHARIVREQADRRRTIKALTRGLQVAHSGEGSTSDVHAIVQGELSAAHRPDPEATSTRIGDLLEDAIESITAGPVQGLSWPWDDLQRVLNPAQPGQLILFAARPAVGKSVACVEVATHAALHLGRPAVLHTLEMSAQEVVHRIIAAEARVPLNHMQRGTVTEAEWSRISEAYARLAAAPLHIVDTPGVGIADLRASVAKHDPAILVLDYVQLAKTNPRLDRRQGLEELSRELKLLAKASGIPVVAAAQLNRGPEQRVDKRPQMSDLRETGALENDADVVVLLHRPDKDDPECERAGEIDLIVAKQRGGGQDTATLVHQLHYARFRDMAA